MKNFKLVDWILILGLVGALLVGGVVVVSRMGGDDIDAHNKAMLSVIPQPIYNEVIDDIRGFDNVLDYDPLFRVIDVYRGDATWCVRVAQDDSELLFSYPDADGIGRFATEEESYGCL